MTEHTPTPWEASGHWVCEENDPGHNVGICICEKRITEAETHANAAFIVEAVNNHKALKARVKKLEEVLRGVDRLATSHVKGAMSLAQCLVRKALQSEGASND